MTKNQKTIMIIGMVSVLSLLFFLNSNRKSKIETNVPNNTIATSTEINASTTKEISNSGVNISGTGNFKVEQLPDVPQPIPSLTRQIVFGTDLSLTPEIKIEISKKISTLQAELKNNPSLFSDWINLGIYQKMAQDYDATVISWTYAGKLSPKNYISFGNLGDLYAYFLKNNAKAEMYYKQAIANGPTQAYLYIQMAEVYRDVFKDIPKSQAILDQGLSKIPNDPSLLQFMASLNK